MPRPRILRPARKAQASQTSYQSQGVDDPGIPQPQVNVESGSSRGIQIPEIVPELVSPYSRTVAYNKMMNDAAVDVSLRVQKTPVLGATYYIEPFDEQPINLEIAEFIEDNLFEGLSAPFLNSLEDVLHFFEDGYSILEKVYELRQWSAPGKGRNSKQYTMLKKLGVRPPTTIQQIQYDDNGGPQSVTQGAIRGDNSVETVDLDVSKLIIFTFNRKGGDLTGKSLLRTAYPHWFYKIHFYKIDAIQKERHSLGVPRGKLGPGASSQDKQELRTLLRNLRSNEESFMILTPNIDVDFAEVHGNLVDVLKSAGHHNTMILLNTMAEFMALGLEGTSGARATGATQADIFMKALRYVANHIADMINIYLIPELVVWNYNTTQFPKMSVRNVGETRDLQMLGSALANVLAQGGITMDLDTENWIRDVFDMPAKNLPDGTVYMPKIPGSPPTDIGVAAQQNGSSPVPGSSNGAAQKGNVSVAGIDQGQGNAGRPPGSPL